MRSIWNGSISFGLVTIPIKMYAASEDRKLDLDMLDSHDHARIRYKRVNEKTGKEVQQPDPLVFCAFPGGEHVVKCHSKYQQRHEKSNPCFFYGNHIEGRQQHRGKDAKVENKENANQ